MPRALSAQELQSLEAEVPCPVSCVLQIRKRHSSGSAAEDRFAASAREYVESLHQNSRTHLLYGKNNVLVQPVSVCSSGLRLQEPGLCWGSSSHLPRARCVLFPVSTAEPPARLSWPGVHLARDKCLHCLTTVNEQWACRQEQTSWTVFHKPADCVVVFPLSSSTVVRQYFCC